MVKEIPGTELLLEGGRKPAIIVFHASWCSVCKTAVPDVEKEIAAQGDKFRVIKIDVDQYGALAEAFGVKSIPTMVGFHGDTGSYGVVGKLPPKDMKKFLSKVGEFQKEKETAEAKAAVIAKAAAEAAIRPITIMRPLKLRERKRFTWLP